MEGTELEDGQVDSGDADDSDADAELEARAEEMGWVPKDQFRGDKSKWVDAKTYVQRGEQILPIVNANMRKMQQQNNALLGEVQQLKTALAASQEAIETLKEVNSQGNLKAVKDNRKDLIAQKKAAEEAGDDELVLELEEQIHDSTAAIREAEKTKPAKEVKKEVPTVTDKSALQTPEFKSWAKENPWFGTDQKRSNYAAFVITQMNASGEAAEFKGRQKDLLDEVSRRVFEDLGDPDQQRTRVSKVEGGRNGSGKNGGGGGGRSGSGTEGRTYNDLPADAKAACERTAKRVVGKGRAFKDINEYRDHYVKVYQWD